MRSTILAGKRARELRRRLTKPEAMLWSRLRARAEDQPVFRRQHPIGVYILDFYCSRAKLVVEVDGEGHAEEAQIQHDERRDAWLRSQGLSIYRIPAFEVMNDVDSVADGIRLKANALAADRTPSSPVYGGGGPRSGGGGE
jgi:very-short-patch-repair endonuclease